jgi:hypothetical protein
LVQKLTFAQKPFFQCLKIKFFCLKTI